MALKIIKAGMDTRQVVARFEAERQALAMMEHPNIAKVLEAGTTDTGRPYFVMELVRGVPVTDYCDEKKLAIRQRLELFITICQAVQHAHQKGIIHRDLKPTNVLVTQQDGRPLAKVIDFGVAKATGQKLTDKTLFTGFSQMIGTPLYMSPEQAELSAQDVDTRSDIYSLGVLLYELLTGATPFDSKRLKSATFDELRRIIREEEPPRPSTRLSTLAQHAISTVSTQRSSERRHLSRLFQGELDWIVMKSLDKDRGRRYETASALAADVERYLRDEPVLASPPSARYRLQKFLRRNKGPVLAAMLVLLALVGGIVGATWGLIQAAKALDEEKTLATIESQSREARRSAKRIGHQDIEPRRERRSVKVGRCARAQEVRRSLLKTAIDGLRQVAGNLKTATNAESSLVKCHLELGKTFFLSGDYKSVGAAEEARDEFILANQIATGLERKHPSDAQTQRNLAASYEMLGDVDMRLGDIESARNAYSKQHEIYRRLAHDDPSDSDAQRSFAESYNKLKNVNQSLDFEAIAPESYQKHLEILQKLITDAPKNLATESSLDFWHQTVGEFNVMLFDTQAADKAFQKVLKVCESLAQGDSKNVVAQHDLAAAYTGLGVVNLMRWEDAEALDHFQSAQKIYQKLSQVDKQNIQLKSSLAASFANLGRAYERLNRWAEAIDVHKKCLKIRRTLADQKPNDPDAKQALATSYDCLARANLNSGSFAAGCDLYREFCRLMPERGDAHAGLAEGLVMLAIASNETPPWDEAADEYVLAIDLSQDNYAPVSPRKTVCRSLARWDELFNRVVKLRPNETTLWVGRSQHWALSGQWHRAASDLERVVRERPLADECNVEYAGLLILDGDAQGYKKFCQELKARLSTRPDDSMAAYIVSFAFAIGPSEKVVESRVVDWAKQAVQWRPEWVWSRQSLGLAEYRAGQYEAALTNLPRGAHSTLFVRAIIHDRLGDTDDLAWCLEEAQQLMKHMQPQRAEDEAHDQPLSWIEINVLSREAEPLLHSKPVRDIMTASELRHEGYLLMEAREVRGSHRGLARSPSLGPE